MNASFDIAEDIVSYIFQSDITQDTIDRLKDDISSRFEKFTKVSLYLEEQNVEKVSFKAVLDELIFNIKNGRKFSRIALVTDRSWLEAIANFKDLLLDAEVRTYKSEERMAAINWIAMR